MKFIMYMNIIVFILDRRRVTFERFPTVGNHWPVAPLCCWHRRSFLKTFFRGVGGIGFGGRGRRGGQRVRYARNLHAAPRSFFHRRHCPRVTHTHGCVPNSPPTTHHPSSRADDGREYRSLGVSREPGGARRARAPKNHASPLSSLSLSHLFRRCSRHRRHSSAIWRPPLA